MLVDCSEIMFNVLDDDSPFQLSVKVYYMFSYINSFLHFHTFVRERGDPPFLLILVQNVKRVRAL